MKHIDNFLKSLRVILNFDKLTPEEKEVKPSDPLLVKKFKRTYVHKSQSPIETDGVKILDTADFERMHENQKIIYDFFNKSHLIKDVDKKKELDFKLQCVERGIAHLEEDLDHNRTKGKQLQEKLETLQQEVSFRKIAEDTLSKTIEDLQELIEREQSKFQQSLKIKDSEWKALHDKFAETTKLYEENNEILVQANQEKEKLITQINKKDNELEEIKKEVEQKSKEWDFRKSANEDYENIIRELKGKILTDYEKDILSNLNQAITNAESASNAFVNQLSEERKKDRLDLYEESIEKLKRDWNETKTPKLPLKKDKFVNALFELVESAQERSKSLNRREELEKTKNELERQIQEKEEIIAEERQVIVNNERQIKDLEVKFANREELLRVANKERAVIEEQSNRLKEDKLELEKEISNFSTNVSDLRLKLNANTERESKLLKFLEIYRASSLIPIPICSLVSHLISDKELLSEYINSSTMSKNRILIIIDDESARERVLGGNKREKIIEKIDIEFDENYVVKPTLFIDYSNKKYYDLRIEGIEINSKFKSSPWRSWRRYGMTASELDDAYFSISNNNHGVLSTPYLLWPPSIEYNYHEGTSTNKIIL